MKSKMSSFMANIPLIYLPPVLSTLEVPEPEPEPEPASDPVPGTSQDI